MKELSIEQKAQRYDEALNKAKHALDCDKQGLVSTDLPLIELMFPELKESEDEKIRKILIHIVKCACDKYGVKYQGKEIGEEKLLAWLEKHERIKENIHLESLERWYCWKRGRQTNLLDKEW